MPTLQTTLRRLTGLLLAVSILLLAACGNDDQSQYRPAFSEHPAGTDNVLVFGVHPLHNPRRLFQVYQPLVSYLNEHLDDHRIKLEASRNYPAYDRKLLDGHFDLALPNPYQTVLALDHGYHVFAKMADDEDFRGIILVRRDGPIDTVADLHGKTVSYPARTALAATIMPQWLLFEQGLDVMEETRSLYVGSQESSIMNLHLGNSQAAATWPPPWRAFARNRPEIAKNLEVRWRTDPLPNNSLMAREDVEPEVVRRLTQALEGLPRSARGPAILDAMESSGFEAADDAVYKPVRRFVQRFEDQVRPIRETP